MRRLFGLAALSLFGLGALGSTSARADIVLFDPTGSGNQGSALQVAQIDQAPGNALAVNAIANGSVISGTPFQLLYQAKIGTLRDANNNAVFVSGFGGSAELTIVAQFNEVATATGMGLSANFSTNTNQANSFVRIYFDSSNNSNDLAGTGFNDGILIYEGRVLPNGGGAFNVTSTTPVDLDQAGGQNNYTGIKSLTGSGGTQISVVTTSQNSNYLLTPLANLTLNFNTSNVAPFSQVDPAAQMFNGTPGVPSVGAINGASGPNFLFQSDATSSFVTAVPEPASLAMMAFGGACTAAMGWKRRRQAKV